MLYVLESPSGPANCKEYFYSGVIDVKNHIAMVQSEGAKTYLFHLGFQYLGDIEEESQLEAFLERRDPNARPGDANDVNYKRQAIPLELVETKTIVPETIASEKVTDVELPSTGELMTPWWDNVSKR